MEKIEVNAEFLFELKSKQQWVNRVPDILPVKTRREESWVWVDKNGNVFETGIDFMAAQKHNTYPCKVYRLSNVHGWENQEPKPNVPLSDLAIFKKIVKRSVGSEVFKEWEQEFEKLKSGNR